MNVAVQTTGTMIIASATHGTHFGFVIVPSTSGRWCVRFIWASDLRSRYWFSADDPEAASQPVRIVRPRMSHPGQPPAPRKAPPTADSTSRLTTRALNRTIMVLKNEGFALSPVETGLSATAMSGDPPGATAFAASCLFLIRFISSSFREVQLFPQS